MRMCTWTCVNTSLLFHMNNTTIAVSRCIHVTIIAQWPPIIWIFQLHYVSVYLLIEASPDVYTLSIPCSRVSIPIFVRAYASYEWTLTMCIENVYTPVCTSPFHMCVLQHRLYPYLFHLPEHVLMCACLHQACSIQIQKIQVNKYMQHKLYIHAYLHIRI